MSNDLFETRYTQLINISDLISEYIGHRGNVSKPKLDRLKAQRYALGLISAEPKLRGVALKFIEVIDAASTGNLVEVIRLANEALAIGDEVQI